MHITFCNSQMFYNNKQVIQYHIRRPTIIGMPKGVKSNHPVTKWGPNYCLFLLKSICKHSFRSQHNRSSIIHTNTHNKKYHTTQRWRLSPSQIIHWLPNVPVDVLASQPCSILYVLRLTFSSSYIACVYSYS